MYKSGESTPAIVNQIKMNSSTDLKNENHTRSSRS